MLDLPMDHGAKGCRAVFRLAWSVSPRDFTRNPGRRVPRIAPGAAIRPAEHAGLRLGGARWGWWRANARKPPSFEDGVSLLVAGERNQLNLLLQAAA